MLMLEIHLFFIKKLIVLESLFNREIIKFVSSAIFDDYNK